MNRRVVLFSLALGIVLGTLLFLTSWPESRWKAGVARRVITPEEPMWMSGYAARTEPANGKLTELWAKALVMEDGRREKAVLVTLDLVGIDRDLSLKIRRSIEGRYGVPFENVALATSHTHSGPVVGRNLRAMYELPPEEWAKIDRYAEKLHDWIVALVGDALSGRREARLAWGSGTARFAVNRRENREDEEPLLREQGRLKGPSDHDVPVLRVTAESRTLAVVFGYACHATVLDSMQWSGDYPAHAQMGVEAAHPGAVAMFWAGCGADQNPMPRRKVELAEEHGRALAAAVNEVLGRAMTPIGGSLSAEYREIDLPFAQVASAEDLEKNLASENVYEQRRARTLKERLARDGGLATSYPYPVQSLRLGNGPRWIFLGGEVVVDYAIRLKGALGNAWVAGYANDVMAYIPSARVLREGGYEGGGAMVYYGMVSPWKEGVEELIVGEVLRQNRP